MLAEDRESLTIGEYSSEAPCRIYKVMIETEGKEGMERGSRTHTHTHRERENRKETDLITEFVWGLQMDEVS